MYWLTFCAEKINPFYGIRADALTQLAIWEPGRKPDCVLHVAARTIEENDIAIRGSSKIILSSEIQRWRVYAPEIVDYLGNGDDHLTSLTMNIFLAVGDSACPFLLKERDLEYSKVFINNRKIKVIDDLIRRIKNGERNVWQDAKSKF